MVLLGVGTHYHDIKDLSVGIEDLCSTTDFVLGELEVLLDEAPSANDYLAVDKFFHDLRDLQFKLTRLHAKFKATEPIFHIAALQQADQDLFKKLSRSSTMTNKLCESFAAKITEYLTLCEQSWKLCESTSIQYNTLVSAIKRGL